MAWYVYVARCSDGSLYTGIAKDVAARIAQHDAGKGAKYTRGRGPLKLCAQAECEEHGDALRLEKRIKALPREEKVKLAKLGKLDAILGALLVATSFICTACDTPAPTATPTKDAAADQAAKYADYLARDAASGDASGAVTSIICTPGPNVDFHGDLALETEVRRKIGKDVKPGAATLPVTEADLGKIRSINLASSKVSQLDPCVYPKMTQLRDLFLGGGDFQDLKPLENLVNLRTLRVANSKVTDLSPLSKLGQMDRMDLGHTSVIDIGVLTHMPLLTELLLDDTLVTDLSPLASLPNLEKVSMMRTAVSDLNPLKSAKKLRFLYIGGSSVHDLSPMDSQVARGLKIISTQ